MNSVVLVGTVCRSPTTRFEGDGLQVTTLTLAVPDPGWQGKGTTRYVPCVSYGKAAEACSLLEAEALIGVQGKVGWRKQRGKCGQEHAAMVIQVQHVEILQGAEVPV